MLKVILTPQGRCAPVIACDVCGKRITDAGQAAVAWSMPGGAGESTNVYHVHRGACIAKIEQMLGPACADERLDDHIWRCAHNVGIAEQLDHVGRRVKALGRVGL